MRFPEVMRWAAHAERGLPERHARRWRTRTTWCGPSRARRGSRPGTTRRPASAVTATATRGDLELIAVVLGVPTKAGCFAEAARLMNEAFATYRVVAPARRGVVGGRRRRRGRHRGPRAGARGRRPARARASAPRIAASIVEARVPRLLQAPMQREQRLGEIVVRRGDEELGRVPVVARSRRRRDRMARVALEPGRVDGAYAVVGARG